MTNVFSYIRECNLFRKLEVDNLLFVEFKCLVEEIRFGMWSDANYFVFVTNGKKMWKTYKAEYMVEAGDALFVKKGANIAHQFHSEDYCALMIFMPDEFIRKFMAKFSDSIKTREPIKKSEDSDGVIRIEVNDFLLAYIRSLESYFTILGRPNNKIITLKFEELLLILFTLPIYSEIATYLSRLLLSRNAQMEKILEENYAYNLKLEEYATLCNMSLSTFKRNFKSNYKQSPAKWLSQKKIDLASHFLKTTNLPINQIAFDCGFEDSSNFIKVFKKYRTQTPLAYRNALEVN